MGKLNSIKIPKTTKVGRHADGNGLYLQVAKNGSKSWIFRFTLNGRAREMGLGSTDVLSLTEARATALECRKVLLNGKDPIEERNAERSQRLLNVAKTITFDEAAESYIKSNEFSWTNKKHAQQWRSTIKTYASPVIGKLPIHLVDVHLITQILAPIWGSKNETASRLQGRLEHILAWAAVNGYRSAENPATWRNQLDKILPKRSLVRKVRHHRALPYEDIAGFITRLQNEEGAARFALEFLLLTVTRTSETLNGEWSEIDEARCLWTIPAHRTKQKREHRIPLCPRAMEILREMRGQDERFIFPGERVGRPFSNMALTAILRRMGFASVATVHGFRSTFRDWSAEHTNFPRDVCEQALGHLVKDKVEAAYRRGDLLLKRTALMKAWGDYCQKTQQTHQNQQALPFARVLA